MLEMICDCMFKALTRRICRFRLIIAGIVLSAILYLIIDVINVSHAEKNKRRSRIHQYFINISRSAAHGGGNADDIMQGNYGNEKSLSCALPEIPLWSREVKDYVMKPPSIKCNEEQDWIFTHHGRFYISPDATKKHGNINCAYVPIVNDKDSFTELKPIVPMLNGSTLVSDAFKITCKAANGKRYTNIHAGIAPISKDKTRKPKSDEFNFLIFGFDSLSAQMFKRLLPKTHSFFTETLGGKLLEGYNIVGDGTPQALMPMLTGKRETEIPEVRRGRPGARHVDDVLTFFWTRCEKRGYVTQWGEDMAHVGTFNLRMLGFREQPVHHYMRPFYLSAIPMYPFYRKHCLGSKPRYKVFVDWIKEGLITNKRKKFFTFGFFSELSHDNNNPVAVMDEESVKLFDDINSLGILDNTVLVLMSDHGIRYGPLRSTEQGKLEERLPYFGFRFPQKFKQMYPSKLRAFEANTKRLVTPFDVYETLIDILGDRETDAASNKGRSLFKEIPQNRSCADAGIEPHWCACLKQTHVSESDFDILTSVNAVLTRINELLEPFNNVCNKVTLRSITKAIRLETNKSVLKFRRTLDEDGRVLDMNDTLQAKEVLYQVTFITEPNNGVFEATVRMAIETGDCKVSDDDISRINKYGDDPWCILDDAPRLRPYCVCRSKNRNEVPIIER